MTTRDGGAPADTSTDDLRVEIDGRPLLPIHPVPPGTTARRTTPPEPAAPRRRRRLLTRLLVVVLAAGVVLAGAGTAAAFLLQRRYDGNIERFGDPFRAIPEAERAPVAAPGDAMNVLLLGSDSRISAGDLAQWRAGAQRTDAIMLAHVPADRSGAQVVSVPRDSWVDIPGHGQNKINAAFSLGGPELMVRTVEGLTGVRVDHVVIVDFTGFTKITDALGGVTITVPKGTGDHRAEFSAGTHRMDGATALNYVRQRYDLPGGDFDRVKRQQNWIRSVVREAMDRGTLTNPLRLNAVLDELTSSIATDDGFTFARMRGLAVSLRAVRPGDVQFLTAPVRGTDRKGSQSVVLLDREAGAGLWQAVARDRLGDWIAANPDAALGSRVN